jgi:hypothetical protein
MISECFRRFVNAGNNWVATAARQRFGFASHGCPSTAPPVR